MWPNNDLMDGPWGLMSLGPSFGIFFGKYEECSVRVWGCIQLHSFASPYGKWVNLSVTVLSHFQNTHKKRREKKKQQTCWGADDHLPWHLTSGSPQKSSLHSRHVLPPNPGLQEHCPVTYNRKITHETQEVKQIFSSMKIHGLQVRMCVGVPQWILWGRAANENTERKSCWFKLEAVAAAGVHISQRNALIDWSVRSHSCLRICENAFLFVSTLSGNWFCLFLVFFLGANWDYPQIYIWFIKTQLRQQQETM